MNLIFSLLADAGSPGFESIFADFNTTFWSAVLRMSEAVVNAAVFLATGVIAAGVLRGLVGADRTRKIVVEHLGVEEDKVVENASFIDDLGADSLDTVELVMAFEEEFGIEIPDDAAETIQTFGDAVKFIKEAA